MPEPSPPALPADRLPKPTTTETIISLLLFVHLFGVGLALASYTSTSPMEKRLLDVLPYLKTLDFDYLHRYPSLARLQLTHGMPNDVDFSVEVEAVLEDGTSETVTIPPASAWGQQRVRFQSLANVMGSLVESTENPDPDSVESVLPTAVAGSILKRAGSKRGTIRIIAHDLPSMDDFTSARPERRDPGSSAYRRTVYTAQIIVRKNSVDLLKPSAKGEAAPVERGGPGSGKGQKPARAGGRQKVMTAVSRYLQEFSEQFGQGWNRFWFTPADPLPLAVVRLLSGLIVLYWYLSLAPDLERLFGPGGWLPVDAVTQIEGTFAPYQWSYLNYLQSSTALWSAYVLGAVALLAFTVGWHTRISAILGLIAVLSTAHRAPLICSQVEPLLTMVMFYLALGPAGACLSVDSWQTGRRAAHPSMAAAGQTGRPHDSLAAGVVTRLLQVHLAMLYGVMGLSKLMSDSWWTGMATWALITRGDSRLIDLSWLHSHPFVVNAWTHAIVLFQIAFAILIWNRLARPLLLALAVAIWCSITLLTGQVAFLLLILTVNLAFVPASALHAWMAGRASSEIPVGG